jgi:putative ABC transport system permease protein
VGDTIRIRDIPFTIVGVGRSPRSQNVVLVPFRTAQIRLFGATALDGILVQLPAGSATQSATVSGQLETLLRRRHNLPPGQADDFAISDAPDATAETPITSTRVLQAIEQFVCSAKNSCARMGVS